MRVTVVGNPGSRRVRLFTAAAVRAGLPEPSLLPWRRLASDESVELGAGGVVRVDSPGEDAEVDQLLRGAVRPASHGEIVGAAAWYAGFGRALDRLAVAAGESGASLLCDPAELRVMFDKAACHHRLRMAGVPVPAALPRSPVDWTDLRTAVRDAGWRRVFVKPRHGSSGSGVLALRFAEGRVMATTAVEREGGRLYNSLRVRTYQNEREIASIVDALAPDGLHVERWFPKAGLGGLTVDLRVLVLRGAPSHIVVRGSRSPMTNLHLGGVRGDLAALRDAAGPAYAAGLDACRAAAACFPGAEQVGVDLMLGNGWRTHAIAEVNAFGDLLPGLLVDGQDTYDAQLAALVAAWI